MILYTIEKNKDELKKLIKEKKLQVFGDVNSQKIPRYARFIDIKNFRELLKKIPAKTNEKKEILKLLEDYDINKEFLVFVMDRRTISKELFCIFKLDK